MFFPKLPGEVYILGHSSPVQCTGVFCPAIIRHQRGDGAEFTRRNKTFKLVYKEEFPTLIEARKREKQIKGWKREKKENLIKFGRPII